jgi:CRISPR-associated protein Csd1
LILQALYELAQAEGLMEDPDFERKPVAWLVRVDKGGRLLGIQGTHEVPTEPVPSRKKPPKPVPKRFVVPRESSRTSGDRAMFLFDKAEYVFGIDPTGERPKAKLTARLSLFREGVKKCLDATGDEGVKAVDEFLEKVESGRQEVALPKDCAPNELFAFIYAPDKDLLVTQRKAVRKYWQSLRSSGAGDAEGKEDAVRCLVSGDACTHVDKHPPIKRVPGGTTSGVALVSFNSRAFESYGWGGNENAPISRDAAEACSTALNRLLDSAPQAPDGRPLVRSHFVISSDTVVCYWAPKAKNRDLLSSLG